MNILFNAVVLPHPSSLTTEWVTVAVENKVYRQLVLKWNQATAAQAAAILGPASAASVTVTWMNPATNASVALNMKLYSAAAPILREVSGTPTYFNLALTLREVLAP